MEEKREKNYRLINMEDVQAREVSWLWYPYIPYGKLTIVQGDPGEGKTTFILHLAALLTKENHFQMKKWTYSESRSM